VRHCTVLGGAGSLLCAQVILPFRFLLPPAPVGIDSSSIPVDLLGKAAHIQKAPQVRLVPPVCLSG